MKSYSFVMVCYNNWCYTKEAVESLLNSLESTYAQATIEMILVDNGSTDTTDEGLRAMEEKVEDQGCTCHIITLEENMGYPMGLNIGLSQATGDYVIVINNDLIFIKGWLEPLIHQLDTAKDIGVATPHLSHGSGVAHVGVQLEDRETIQEFGRRYMARNKEKIDYVDRVVGACMVIKKEVVSRVGGNDFWFGIGHYDDDDWALRMRIAGYRLVVVGGSFVYHQGSQTFRSYYPNQSYYVYLNKKKFWRKWGLEVDSLVDGRYVEREHVIHTTPFTKKRHYIPLINQDKSSQVHGSKGKLWVADWENRESGWYDQMNYIKEELQAGVRIYVWIPSCYYTDSSRHLIHHKMREGLGKSTDLMKHLEVISQGVAPIGLQAFLRSFKNIITVPQDFVNGALRYQRFQE